MSVRDRRLQRRSPSGLASTPFSPASIASRFAWYRGDLGVTAAAATITGGSELDNAAWTKSACTLGVNATTDPIGGSAADEIIEDTASTFHRVVQTVAGANTGPITISTYAKSSGRSWLRFGFGGTPTQTAWFNLGAGTVGTQTGVTATISSAGNGWYLCTVNAQFLTSVTTGLQMGPASGDGNSSYLGTGIGSIYTYGTTVTQSRVSTWADQVGARDLIQATVANQPTIATLSDLNDQYGVIADGVADKLPFPSPASDWRFTHDGTGCTIYLVVRTPAAASEGTLLDSARVSNANTGFTFYHQAAGNPIIRASNASGTALFTHSATAVANSTSYQYLITHSTAAGYVIRRNGVELASGAYTGSAAAGDSTSVLGLFDPVTSVATFSNWTVAEMLFCNAVISASDITSLEAYGASRYAL